MSQKLPAIICFLFIFYVLTLTGGCKKEYSYEGGPIQDSTLVPDPGIIPDTHISFPYCDVCNSINTPAPLTWRFKIGTSHLCGNITRGVLSPDGGGLTFFGPSACSRDTGLIITAFFSNQVLDRDQSNLITSRASLVYYDNVTTIDLLQSKRPNIFSLTIDNYNSQTGIATGTFNGAVVDKNGNIVIVEDGKFNVQF